MTYIVDIQETTTNDNITKFTIHSSQFGYVHKTYVSSLIFLAHIFRMFGEIGAKITILNIYECRRRRRYGNDFKIFVFAICLQNVQYDVYKLQEQKQKHKINKTYNKQVNKRLTARTTTTTERKGKKFWLLNKTKRIAYGQIGVQKRKKIARIQRKRDVNRKQSSIRISIEL